MANIDIRLPNITGGDPATQMAQMQSYMYQMVQQLNWALNTLDSPSNDSSNLVVTDSHGNEISSSDAHAQATFDEIKSLIIKSADIVNAYYESMSETLHGEFVAESDFGIYKDATQQEIIKNSTDIQQKFDDVQTIITNNYKDISDSIDYLSGSLSNAENTIESINRKIIETNSWIKSGLLEEKTDGTKIYGVEVGQIDTVDGVEKFNKYARFTAGGIYFYLPGYNYPVSWMTGSKLYITNAEIIGSLKIGKYVLDLSSGIAFKWSGGAS